MEKDVMEMGMKVRGSSIWTIIVPCAFAFGLIYIPKLVMGEPVLSDGQTQFIFRISLLACHYCFIIMVPRMLIGIVAPRILTDEILELLKEDDEESQDITDEKRIL